MSCNFCFKDVEEIIRKKVNLSVNSEPIETIKAWLNFWMPSFNSLDIDNPINIQEEFVQEVKIFLEKFDLIAWLKQIANDNKKAVNVLCAIAYCGLLSESEDSEVWGWRQKGGATVAHWAAKGGNLNFPFTSKLWRIWDYYKNTPAHYAAENGFLNVPFDSELWFIKNKNNETPAHWSARNGRLIAPYDSELWIISDKDGQTPAHWAAQHGYFTAPYDSELWLIPDKDGQTPAHLVAQHNKLNVPYDSRVWRVQNRWGNTPAHFAASKNLLGVLYDSELWYIQNKWGGTPAHFAAQFGFLNAPYDSELWFIQDNSGATPAHHAAENGLLFAPYDSKLWLIPDNGGDTPAHWVAIYKKLNAPYDSIVWRVRDNYGNTPAHWAAKVGQLLVHFDSDLWCISNDYGDTPAHWAAKNGRFTAPPDSKLWGIQNKDGNTPLHYLVMNNHTANVLYKSAFWFIENNQHETPIAMSEDSLTISLHHSDRVVKKCFLTKAIDIGQCKNIWDMLGYIRLSLLTNNKNKLLRDINYQFEVQAINVRYPELCDFSLMLKNATQSSVLLGVFGDTVLRDAYCYILASAFVNLLEKDKESVANALYRSAHTYVNDSVFFRLSEYGLWQNIVRVMSDNYGITLNTF